MEQKIAEMQKALRLVRERNFEELEKEFEPETECKNCYFCMKPSELIADRVPRHCLLQVKALGDNVTGCYGGWKKKNENNM